MRKILFTLLALLIAVVCLCSCSTSKTIKDSVLYVPAMGSYEDDTVKIFASTRQLFEGATTSSYIELTIRNKGQSLISLDLDKSTYSLLGMVSNRLLDGEVRKINSNLPQATIPIAPNTSTTRYLFSDDLITNIDSSIYITIQIDGKDVGFTIYLHPDTSGGTVIGKVSVEGKLRGNIYKNREDDIQEALLKEAQRLYGNDVQIVNISYDLKTNALGAAAAIYTFGLISSQSYSATADVVRY